MWALLGARNWGQEAAHRVTVRANFKNLFKSNGIQTWNIKYWSPPVISQSTLFSWVHQVPVFNIFMLPLLQTCCTKFTTVSKRHVNNQMWLFFCTVTRPQALSLLRTWKSQGVCFSFLLLLSYLQGIRPTPGIQLCFLLESGRLNQRTARCLENAGSLAKDLHFAFQNLKW